MFLQEEGTRPPECLPATALGFTHSCSSLICVSSARITNGGAGGSYSARPGPGKACELIALIEWEGLPSSRFCACPVWSGMNGGPTSAPAGSPCGQLGHGIHCWDPHHGQLSYNWYSGPSLCEEVFQQCSFWALLSCFPFGLRNILL